MTRFLHSSHLGKRKGFNQKMLMWVREPELGLRKVYGPGRQFLGSQKPRGGANVCDG